MMTVKELREDYVRYSTTVSSLCRNLSFAGIGVIWIFKIEKTTMIPHSLYSPLLLFIIALIVDLAQYVIQTGIWYLYYLRHKPNSNSKETEESKQVNEPEWVNIIPWIFWLGKLLFVAIAYWKLGIFVSSRILS